MNFVLPKLSDVLTAKSAQYAVVAEFSVAAVWVKQNGVGDLKLKCLKCCHIWRPDSYEPEKLPTQCAHCGRPLNMAVKQRSPIRRELTEADRMRAEKTLRETLGEER